MTRRWLPVASAALAGFRGLAREGGLVGSVGLVAAAVAAGMALTPASVDDGGRLAADLGWGAAGLLGWILALGHGSGVVGGGGVVAPAVLARPISPSALLFARFAGHAGGLVVHAAAATLLVGLGSSGSGTLLTGWLLGLRLLVVLSVATALFALSRPALAAPLAAAVSSAGWLSHRLPGPEAEGWLRPAAAVARRILPDLSRLDHPGFGQGAPPGDATLYAALYVAGVLLVATAAFPAVLRRSGR